MNLFESYHLKSQVVTSENNDRYLFYPLKDVDLKSVGLPIEMYVNTLKTIPGKHKIMIPMSGGIDSESLFLSCLKAQIEFTPVINRFAGGFNAFDIQHAEEICQRYGKKPVILDMDIDKFFFNNEHHKYSREYQCRSPQLATHLWMMEQVDGNFIFPYNPPPLLRDKNSKIYIGFPPFLYSCYDIFFQKNRRFGISHFAFSTPEIIYSFLKLPLYLEALFDERFFACFTADNYLFKCEAYRQGGFDSRPKKYKATGFERYRQHLNDLYSSPEEKHLKIDYFDQKFRVPMEKIVDDPCLVALGEVNLEMLFNYYQKSQ